MEPFSRDKEEFILLDPHQAWQHQFFMDLVFLKTNRVHIFLCYFWFKSFPVLLLVLILIYHFNFILVWVNIGFWWSIAGGFQIEEQEKQFAHSAKFSQGMRNQGIILHGVRNFAHPANQIRKPNKNKLNLAKFSQTMRKISHTQINFTHCTKPKGVCEVISHP